MGRAVTVTTADGQALTVDLAGSDGREATTLYVGGLPCHLERIRREELTSLYRVDGDPDYSPVADQEGYCYLLVPFSA
jgi:hypothetical protein